MFLCFVFLFSAFRVSGPFSVSPPCSSLFSSSVESFCLRTLIPFHLLAAFSMTRSKLTPNPSPSPRNPPAQTRKANPSSSRDPPRGLNASSERVARPPFSYRSQPQPNPPQTSAGVEPLPDYKRLYSWASATLLGETSSINSDLDVIRLKRRDKANLSFSKEHDDKVVVRPCPPGEPICTNDQGSDGTPFCFIYTTTFKKVKLRVPFTRFERELLTELDIAPAQLHPNSWAFVRAYQIICTHLGLPASVDVFLYLFEAKNPGDSIECQRIISSLLLESHHITFFVFSDAPTLFFFCWFFLHFNRFASSFNCLVHTLWVVFAISPSS